MYQSLEGRGVPILIQNWPLGWHGRERLRSGCLAGRGVSVLFVAVETVFLLLGATFTGCIDTVTTLSDFLSGGFFMVTFVISFVGGCVFDAPCGDLFFALAGGFFKGALGAAGDCSFFLQPKKLNAETHESTATLVIDCLSTYNSASTQLFDPFNWQSTKLLSVLDRYILDILSQYSD